VAALDVTELLSDPDFVDEIHLYRRTMALDVNARPTITEAPAEIVVASVQPGPGSFTTRLDAGAYSSDYIEVYYAGPLSGAVAVPLDPAAPYPYADLIIWRGKRYVCKLADDYMNYGAGYTHALFELEGVPNA
jgi:hypothetical protein